MPPPPPTFIWVKTIRPCSAWDHCFFVFPLNSYPRCNQHLDHEPGSTPVSLLSLSVLVLSLSFPSQVPFSTALEAALLRTEFRATNSKPIQCTRGYSEHAGSVQHVPPKDNKLQTNGSVKVVALLVSRQTTYSWGFHYLINKLINK